MNEAKYLKVIRGYIEAAPRKSLIDKGARTEALAALSRLEEFGVNPDQMEVPYYREFKDDPAALRPNEPLNYFEHACRWARLAYWEKARADRLVAQPAPAEQGEGLQGYWDLQAIAIEIVNHIEGMPKLPASTYMVEKLQTLASRSQPEAPFGWVFNPRRDPLDTFIITEATNPFLNQSAEWQKERNLRPVYLRPQPEAAKVVPMAMLKAMFEMVYYRKEITRTIRAALVLVAAEYGYTVKE